MGDKNKRMQVKYRGKLWVADEESAALIRGAIRHYIVEDRGKPITEEEEIKVTHGLWYLNNGGMEIRGDELWIVGTNPENEDERIEHFFKEVAIIIRISGKGARGNASDKKSFLVEDGIIIKAANNKEEILDTFTKERVVKCGCCGKEVKVRRLKDADTYLMVQPRALMEGPKQYMRDYILEICPECTFARRDITLPIKAAEKECLKHGCAEFMHLSERSPIGARGLINYSMLALQERNYNQALLCAMYAFDYEWDEYIYSLDRMVIVRNALLNIAEEAIKETHLCRLDIIRRTENRLSVTEEYDGFDFSSPDSYQYRYGMSTRDAEAEYLSSLDHRENKTKKTDKDFKEMHGNKEEFLVDLDEGNTIATDGEIIEMLSADMKRGLEQGDVKDIKIGDLVIIYPNPEEKEIVSEVISIKAQDSGESEFTLRKVRP